MATNWGYQRFNFSIPLLCRGLLLASVQKVCVACGAWHRQLIGVGYCNDFMSFKILLRLGNPISDIILTRYWLKHRTSCFSNRQFNNYTIAAQMDGGKWNITTVVSLCLTGDKCTTRHLRNTYCASKSKAWQTDRQTDLEGQSNPHVGLCFTSTTKCKQNLNTPI